MWAREQDGVWQAGQVAERFGMTLRNTYRYLAALRPWLRSSPGVGYMTRKEPVYV